MSQRIPFGTNAFFGCKILVTCASIWILFATCVAADDAKPATKSLPAENVFGLSRLWTIDLEISAKEYEAMQPPPGGFGAPGAPPVQRKPTDNRERERNLFGTEFPWAHADLFVDGKSYKDIGVRYAGEITYLTSSQGLKRPLKLDLAKFSDQEFEGLTSLQLHAMPMDPAKGREIIAGSVFQSAGVPSPRTGFAEITLTVPGKFNKEYLGLYALIENVDKQFLQSRYGTNQGVLLKPFQVRTVEYLGDDWERYKGLYRPQEEPSKEQSQRIMSFARLVHQAGEAEFQKEIDGYLDIDAFLRFLAANALTSNLESVFALGHNYHLYLNPQTNKFAFVPADLEFALANFLLMGTAEQLMDLSLTHPYPGENRLVERLLKIDEINKTYQILLKDLAERAFDKKRLFSEIESLEQLTKDPLSKEKIAVAARKEAPPAFGPPGVAAPQPPGLREFVEKRIASIQRQLAGASKGYVPAPFGFGPPTGGGPGRAAPNQPTDEAAFRELVKVPEGFDATLFAAPPQIGYPVALATTPSGELFVAVDEQGSIGTTPGGGKVLRCVDQNGDGKVDEVTLFARMEHPRGLVYQDGSLWVLHAASLSVYRDGGKGPAEASEVLVTGLTSEMVNQRGGDHATNGIRMGLDGWIYIAVGDYGCPDVKGKDGSRAVIRGGILRVRPDGTDLEVFATGLRNPFDIGMDPFMNLFTRDNDDNRAGGWDIRVLHLIQSGYYGYSQHYANFPDEIMPPLGQFGGGSGVGTLFLQDERWPVKYKNVLITGDWGRSEVYRHELAQHGPTFDLKQEVFLKFPRPTGIDLDASGRLYVASWRGGEASTYVGPNVGFIARITPSGWKPSPFHDVKRVELSQLIRQLNGPNLVTRLQAQREILSRGRNLEITNGLIGIASDSQATLEGRAAAIFTLKQLDGLHAQQALLKLAAESAVREFALRALTDRKLELEGLEPTLFVTALSDESPRVRAQALISLGRLNDVTVAKQILPLTRRPEGSVMPTKKEVHAQPDADRVIPHLAVQTLIKLGAAEACLEGLDGPDAEGALWAMRYMHDKKTVEGLIRKLGTVRSPELRRGILSTLIRLYYREADYTGAWWGIRPENAGPYFDASEWSQSARIESVISRALLDADPETADFLRKELSRHRVPLDGLPNQAPSESDGESNAPVVIRAADPNHPNQIGNLTYDAVASRTLKSPGDPARGKVLFKSQSCSACHTDADGQTLKGPHLVDIGKRYSGKELVESILKPSVKIAQGFEGYVFEMANGKIYTGFIVSQGAKAIMIREANGVPRELKLSEIETKVVQKQSNMPEGIVAALTPEELSDLIAYLQSLINKDSSETTSETLSPLK